MPDASKKFRSVMVIDDNQMDRYIAELMLTKSGITEKIMMYADASAAISDIKKSVNNVTELPELIFLDINMPHVNGFDFLDEYDKLPDDIKDLVFIIMLTSSIHEADRKTASTYPYVRGIIHKPLTLDELRELDRFF